MVEKPLVSIIIPTYNRNKTILDAVNSILVQTYTNFELIVVDDGSTDNTIEKLKTVQDLRLKIIVQESNQGACVARNRGIEISKGDYIAFQDSDDLWHPTKLQRQMDIIMEKNADIVFCRAERRRFDDDSVELLPNISKSGLIDKQFLQAESIVSTQMILARAECFNMEKFDPKMPRYQDYDLVIRLSEKYRFYYIAEPLVTIIVQGDSITSNPQKGVNARKLIFKKYSNLILENTKMHVNMLKSLIANEARLGVSDVASARELFLLQKSFKNFIKYFLCLTHIYPLVVKRH